MYSTSASCHATHSRCNRGQSVCTRPVEGGIYKYQGNRSEIIVGYSLFEQNRSETFMKNSRYLNAFTRIRIIGFLETSASTIELIVVEITPFKYNESE